MTNIEILITTASLISTAASIATIWMTIRFSR